MPSSSCKKKHVLIPVTGHARMPASASKIHTAALRLCRLVLFRATAPLCVVTLFLPCFLFFFNDTATTEIYTLSLHDALPILLEVVREVCQGVPQLAAGLVRH